MLLFNFLFPGSANADLGINHMLKSNLGYEHCWGGLAGWCPVLNELKLQDEEIKSMMNLIQA